jgi:hypothetical protein
MALFSSAWAQTVVTLGTQDFESGSDGAGPTNYDWPARRIQFVYTAAEIIAAGEFADGFRGDISALAWDVLEVATGNLVDYRVKLAHTTAVDASSHNYTPLTTVKAAHTFTPGAIGWRTIPFDTNFTWDGSSNLLVDITWGPNAAWASNGQTWLYNNVWGQRRYIASEFYSVENTDTGITRYGKPRAQLTITPFIGVSNPVDFTASPYSHSQINLDWAQNVDNDNVMLAWNSTDTFGTPSGSYTAGSIIAGGGTVLLANSNATSYNHTGRDPITNYYYKIWSVNDPTNYSLGETATALTMMAPIASFPWSESFEDDSSSRVGWTQEYLVGRKSWDWATGSNVDSGASITTAHGGILNARYTAGPGQPVTKLISPMLDLSTLSNPNLSFWYGQELFISLIGDLSQNTLTLYYRTSPQDPWIQIGSPYTEDISHWTKVSDIALPNPSSTYQIAFEGYDDWAYANVLDDVLVNATFPWSMDFTGVATGSLPAGWTQTGPSDKWSVQRSNAAGGTSPELKFNYLPQETGQFRLITPPLDGGSTADLMLSFKHNIRYYAPTTYAVQYSIDSGSTWNTLWSTGDHTGDVDSTTQTVDLSMINTTFQLAWLYDGNSTDTSAWYVDDIAVFVPDPEMSLSASSYDYGLAFLDAESCPPRSFSATNTGTGNITIAAPPVISDPDNFSIIDDNNQYPIILGADVSASWKVKFHPTGQSGEKTATMSFVDDMKRNQPKMSYAIALRGFGNVGVFEDYFETYTHLSPELDPWTLYDADNTATRSLFAGAGQEMIPTYTGAFIGLDGNGYPYETGTNWLAHSGDKYLGCASAQGAQNNDWLISPQLSFAANPRISFFAKSLEADYSPESFNVLYSTNGNSYSDFGGNNLDPTQIQTVGTNWTLFEYELPADCANTNTYIAIQCVSNGKAMLMVDDFVAVGDESLVIFVPGPESVVGGEIPDGLQGPDTGNPALIYTTTSTGTHDVVVMNPGWQSDWYCWIQVGSTIYAADNPIPATANGFTFSDVDFDPDGEILVIVNDNNNETLPVELSSFTAVLTSDLYVNIAWTAESETNHAGYNVLRSEVKELSTAMMINNALIDAGSVNGTQISYQYADAEVYRNARYYYWLEDRSLTGESKYHGPLMVTISAQGDEPEIPAIPVETKLFSAFPNPFNPSTNLRYSMKEAGDVSIEVYNVKGQLLKSFNNNHNQAGYYQVNWDGRDSNGSLAGTGVYFYRMISGKYTSTKKMVLAK